MGETYKAMQSIETSQSQMKEVIEPCDSFAQNIDLSEAKTTKALKSRDSSLSRVQEIVTPMEVTKSQEETSNESEKAIQQIVPLEPKIKEVVEPYGNVSSNIGKSKITKSKANKARDGLVPGEQETVMPIEFTKPQEENSMEEETAFQDMITSESQLEEVVQPCDILNEDLTPSEIKIRKAKKSRDSSISRVQEIVLPSESTRLQEKTKDEEEKALQDMVPSESQVEEVIQPCDILSEYDASSNTKKSKAKRSRDTSISRVQETVLPMEFTKAREQTKPETEKVIQDMVPSESQVKEVVESCGILSDHIVQSESKKKKAKKSRDTSISRVQEAVLPLELTKSQEQQKTEEEIILQSMVPSEPQIEEVVQPCGLLKENIEYSEGRKKKSQEIKKQFYFKSARSSLANRIYKDTRTDKAR